MQSGMGRRVSAGGALGTEASLVEWGGERWPCAMSLGIEDVAGESGVLFEGRETGCVGDLVAEYPSVVYELGREVRVDALLEDRVRKLSLRTGCMSFGRVDKDLSIRGDGCNYV